MRQKRNTQQAGMAGEFHVMSMLYRLGYTPLMTLGNTKSVDIVCECPPGKGRYVEIDVKSSKGAHNWPICRKEYLDSLKLDDTRNRYYVLLNYEDIGILEDQPETWVIPAHHIRHLVRPWEGGMYALYKTDFPALLDSYRNRWDLLQADDIADPYSVWPEPDHVLAYPSRCDDPASLPPGTKPFEMKVEFVNPDGSPDLVRSMLSRTISRPAFDWVRAVYQGGWRKLMAFDDHPFRVISVGRNVIKAAPIDPEDNPLPGADWTPLEIKEAMAQWQLGAAVE